MDEAATMSRVIALTGQVVDGIEPDAARQPVTVRRRGRCATC